MLGGIIGGALSAITSGVGMGLQAHQNKKNQEREDKIRRETWEREDNAVQRRAKDMEMAGINPLLAAGDPAQASTGGAVTGQNAPSTEGLAGSIQNAGQIADQMAMAKKMQVLAEQKQDAEIAKIEAETEGKLKENEGADDRNEQVRLQNEKIKRENEKIGAEIEGIMANTELTKEKQKSEIQKRMIDGLIENGKIEGNISIAGWIGAKGEEKTYRTIEDIYKDLEDGNITSEQAIEKAWEEIKEEYKKTEERTNDYNEARAKGQKLPYGQNWGDYAGKGKK